MGQADTVCPYHQDTPTIISCPNLFLLFLMSDVEFFLPTIVYTSSFSWPNFGPSDIWNHKIMSIPTGWHPLRPKLVVGDLNKFLKLNWLDQVSQYSIFQNYTTSSTKNQNKEGKCNIVNKQVSVMQQAKHGGRSMKLVTHLFPYTVYFQHSSISRHHHFKIFWG